MSNTDHLLGSGLLRDGTQFQVKDMRIGLFSTRLIKNRQTQRVSFAIVPWYLVHAHIIQCDHYVSCV